MTMQRIAVRISWHSSSIPRTDKGETMPDIKGAKKDLKKAQNSLRFNGYNKWFNHKPSDAAELHIQNAIDKLNS